MLGAAGGTVVGLLDLPAEPVTTAAGAIPGSYYDFKASDWAWDNPTQFAGNAVDSALGSMTPGGNIIIGLMVNHSPGHYLTDKLNSDKKK